MEFRVLGPVEAIGPDGPLATGGHRQRLLLSHLLAGSNQLVTAETLIDPVLGPGRHSGGSPQRAPGIDLTSPPGVQEEQLGPRESGYAVRVEPGELGPSRGSRSSYATGGRSWMRIRRTRPTRCGRLSISGAARPSPILADERSLQGEIARLAELRSLAEEERISCRISPSAATTRSSESWSH